jgi:CelD/BcsL family acetyltransferase involved in cellulose biosynthesis
MRIVADGPGFAAALADWDALKRCGAAVGLFQDHAWLTAWWAAIEVDPAMRSRHGLYVVVLEDAEGPALILPLVVDRGRRPKRLHWMAAAVSDYCDAIAAPEAAPGLWPEIRRTFEESGAGLAELVQIRPDSAASRLFGAGLAPGAVAKSPYIDLKGRTWEEVEKGFSSQFRQEMRRKGRRLAKRVPWQYVEFSDAPSRLKAVEFILAQKRAQLSGDAAALETLERVFAPFARAIFAREAVGPAGVHVAALKAGDTLLAVHLGFADAERFYYYVPAYNPAYQADSPGQLLIYELVRRACEARIPVFDMLRGDYGYKWRLTDQSVELRTLSLGLTLPGSAYLCLRKLVRGLKRK